MKKSDFIIGKDFFTASGRSVCTDVGSRTIVAIKKDKEDHSWHNGPPYAVEEVVFDEYDFEGYSKNALHEETQFSYGQGKFAPRYS